MIPSACWTIFGFQVLFMLLSMRWIWVLSLDWLKSRQPFTLASICAFSLHVVSTAIRIPGHIGGYFEYYYWVSLSSTIQNVAQLCGLLAVISMSQRLFPASGFLRFASPLAIICHGIMLGPTYYFSYLPIEIITPQMMFILYAGYSLWTMLVLISDCIFCFFIWTQFLARVPDRQRKFNTVRILIVSLFVGDAIGIILYVGTVLGPPSEMQFYMINLCAAADDQKVTKDTKTS
ncbi:hypothetical protein EDD86DRAFT_246209 [Gorgonomyces haynaldii]|nr:hypothetical protein EDD86DRAFT_246209 [Gorgonomyces haynaldii]